MRLKKDSSEQKLRGAYYTPQKLANAMVRLFASENIDTVLEPSCGDGVFLDSLKETGFLDKVSRVEAVEIEAPEAQKVSGRYKDTPKVKVINQFVSPKTYFNYLKNEVIVVKDLMFETSHAEDKYMAVLAAEILSRYAYLQYYANMTKSLKMNLSRGTSTAVDAVAAKIATKYGEKMLMKVAKLNFTNTKRVKALLEEQ